MLDFAWLKENRASKQLAQNRFFELSKAILFLPSLPALGLLGKADIIPHTDSLYEMEQAVFGEKTLGYIIRALCPTVKVIPNLIVLHSRKTIDTSTKHKVYVQSALPHFNIINSVNNATSMFCRDVSVTPKT